MKRDRLAALLAVILGLLSMTDGGSILLGLSTTTYTILPWLVWFNVVIGFSSVLCGRGLWLKQTWANKLADTIVTLHGLVLLNLIVLFAFHQPVTLASVIGMFFRTAFWIGIILLTRWKVSGEKGKAWEVDWVTKRRGGDGDREA